MLLFPRVVDAAASLIERLAPTEALMALLPASGGILAGGAPGQSQAQLTALGGLVATVPAPARGDLDREYIDSSARALARYHELGALLGRLGEAEIPVIALKGVYSPRRSTRSRGCVP